MPRPIFEDSGPPLSEVDVTAAETALGLAFPEQYRRFLLNTNGGQPKPYAVRDMPVDIFYSIGEAGGADLVYSANLSWELGMPEDLLAIGYGVFGDTICLGVRGARLGRVFVHDHEFDEYKLYAEDFDTFLDSFYEPDLSDLENDEDEDDEDGDSREP